MPARIFAAAAAAAVLLIFALRGSGSYDIVTFQEHGLLIWWFLAIGVALGLIPRARPSRVALLLLGALAAYAAWTALSLTWTQSQELTMQELARSLDYLGLVALAICLLTRESWRDAVTGLIFAALLVCLIAVGSRLAPSLFGVDHVDQSLHLDRLAYPFGYWNAAAAWGAMCTALALTSSAHDSSRVRRALALGLVPVAATMTYLTYSRAGLAGIGLGVLAAIALSRNRIAVVIHTIAAGAGTALVVVAIRHSPHIAHATGTEGAATVAGALAFSGAVCVLTAVLTRRARVDRRRVPGKVLRPVAAVAIGLALIAAVAVGPRLATRAWHSFKRSPVPAAGTDPAVRLSTLSGNRYVVWKSAINAFDAHPTDGTGAGTFEFWWNEHGTNSEFIRDAHNIWLENMAELGLPGLLLTAAVVAAAFAVAVVVRARSRRASTAGLAAAVLAALAVYLLHASVDWMWESTAVTVLALAGVGALSARLAGARIRLNVAMRALLTLGAAAAAVVQLPGLISTLDIRSSQAAARAGNSATALVRARDAVSAESWSASAHEQEALVLEAQSQLTEAERQESVAISYEPDNYAHWLIRSRINAERGQIAAAASDYVRARELRPHAFVFLLEPSLTTR